MDPEMTRAKVKTRVVRRPSPLRVVPTIPHPAASFPARNSRFRTLPSYRFDRKGEHMKYQANPVIVDAFAIRTVFPQTACASAEAGIVCGEPLSAHTHEAARGDVGMDHDYVAGTWDAEGTGLMLEDGSVVTATPEMTSRMMPVA